MVIKYQIWKQKTQVRDNLFPFPGYNNTFIYEENLVTLILFYLYIST